MDSINLISSIGKKTGHEEMSLESRLEVNGTLFHPELTLDLQSLAKSCQSAGEMDIFTCGCGIPPCAGIFDGIKIMHLSDAIEWHFMEPLSEREYMDWSDEELDTVRKPVRLRFDPEQYLQAIGAGTWCEAALKNSDNGWCITYVRGGQYSEPVTFLASVDEVYVFATEYNKQGFSLKGPAYVEDLLWRAHLDGIRNHYVCFNSGELSNPEDCMERNGTVERVAEEDRKRMAFTRSLTELRVDPEYGSSGLWDEQGQMLSYDLIALPFPLVRRLAAWQRDFEETNDPPKTGDDVWWDQFDVERMSIARELQDVLGAVTKVKIFEDGAWKAVSRIA